MAAAFAGPTVTLFNSHDDALWLPTQVTLISERAAYATVLQNRSIHRTVDDSSTSGRSHERGARTSSPS